MIKVFTRPSVEFNVVTLSLCGLSFSVDYKKFQSLCEKSCRLFSL